MKKIILLLLLVIPVIITLLVYMIAGFIAREIQYVAITGIHINYNSAENAGLFTASECNTIFESDPLTVGDEINLRNIITVQPARARFESLHFQVVYEGTTTESEAITVINGVLGAAQSTTIGTTVEVRVIVDTNILMTILVHRIHA
ncbi:MAG: hypothetical protein FWE45_05385 [Firmicutes bacterium]|nr:hypothetical protein [Bacillota bacterium]